MKTQYHHFLNGLNPKKIFQQLFLNVTFNSANIPPTSFEDNLDIPNFQTCVIKIFEETEQNMPLSDHQGYKERMDSSLRRMNFLI